MLELDHVTIAYGETQAVEDFSLHMEPGEIVSLVGESGSGKTSVIRGILGLLPGGGAVTQGNIVFDGKDLLDITPEQWRTVRGREISMIFQDSGAMMNPTRKIGTVFAEYLRTHEKLTKKEAWKKGTQMLARMRLPSPENIMCSYPFQLSGGMAQRVTIALAACSRARLLIADEPTNGLDEAGRTQFFALLDSIFPDAAKLIITHDISVAARCDRVLVLCGGRMLETGVSSTVLSAPRHPYTKALLAAQVANGMQPSPVLREGASGCPFYARCPKADEACLNGEMQKHTDEKTEWWCCHA